MTEQDVALAEEMASFYSDPLGFVMYAFPWDTEQSIQLVRLEEPWASKYGCEFGPDKWACQFLEDLGAQIAERDFDGTTPVAPIQMAVSSGHGIGKSAMAAWLTLFIMSTRPHSRGVVTANTGEQLASKTWAGVSAWKSRCITGHWFDITTGKGSMRLTHRQHHDTWRVDAQTSREENSESFAGLHAANSTPWYLFDEASAIPPTIWEVAEGGKTDGEPMHFAFGNPTRNTGAFAEAFGKNRHRWNTRHIDSRSVAITNKALLQAWVDDYGEDSDFVRIRVRGIFPRSSSLQFIPRDLVDAAMAREPTLRSVRGLTAAVGVDVARFGGDNSVIRTRIGRDAASIKAKRFNGLDTMQLAARVAEHVNDLRNHHGLLVVIFVDGGGIGGGVVDRLRQLNYDVIEVQFGGKAVDDRKYANKRAEMWGAVKEWLPFGVLEKDEQLATDLTAVEYGFRPNDQILLERKEAMKARGLASPDDGDALALTFAQPVPEGPLSDAPPADDKRQEVLDHNPYAGVR